MASIRQQLVDAIVTCLGQITPGKVWTLPDGSYTCSSQPKSVTAWRCTPFSVVEVPAIAIWDSEGNFGDAPIAHFEHRLVIHLAGYVVGANAAVAARAMLADMAAAIGSDQTWGGLARWTEISNQQLNAEQAADVVVGCEMNIVVVYRTRLWRM